MTRREAKRLACALVAAVGDQRDVGFGPDFRKLEDNQRMNQAMLELQEELARRSGGRSWQELTVELGGEYDND